MARAYEWSKRDRLTYCLLTLVFLASWTDINGIFNELPQIIMKQPEKWKLASDLTLITNIGNIAPFTLIVLKYIFAKKTFDPVPINYFIIIIGMISCFLLIFFWDRTSVIRNQEYSTALLLLALFLSLLDCTSSVTFADYLQRFSKQFVSSLFLGESLTAIIPSLLAMAQGNGRLHCIESNNTYLAIYETGRFSISIYFFCLFVLLSISLISFVLLQWTSVSRQLKNETNQSFVDQTKNQSLTESIRLNRFFYVCLSIGCVYTSSILFGVLLSISTFILMPYGHEIFYLGTILSPWMFAIVWALSLIKPIVSKRILFSFIILGTMTFAISLSLALKSPCPLWVNTNQGNIFVLTVWLCTYFLFGYPRIVIANYVRNHSSSAMFWYGVQVQIGALLGSIVSYVTVNIYPLFHERMPCEKIQC